MLVHWEGGPGTSRPAMQRVTEQVSEELRELPGVSDVRVSHATGQVVVTSDAPLDVEAVRAAIVEAGYELRT